MSMFAQYSFKFRLRELFKISAPVIAEQTFITLMGVVNTILVASVGEYAVSAVSFCDSLSNIVVAFFAALTTGGTIVVAQYIGKREYENATAAAAQAIFLAVVLSGFILVVFLLFGRAIIAGLLGKAEVAVVDAAFAYFMIVIFSFPVLALNQTIFGILRGSGNTASPMFITLAMNAFNIVLGFSLIKGIDFWLIKTPAYGVKGAAVAISVSRLLGLCIAAFYLARRSKIIKLNNLRVFKPKFSIQKVVLGLGIPTSVETLLFQVGRLITQLFIVGMGTSMMAANSISSSIFLFVNVPANAFTVGVMILVGHRIGRKEDDDVIHTTKFAIICGGVMMLIICLICLPFTNAIISLYQPTPQTASYIGNVMYCSYVAYPLLWTVSFITPAALRATGDVKFTMVVAIFSMWVFRITVGYVFGVVLKLGVLGIWFGMYADWLVRTILFYWRLVSGKWRNKGIK